MAPLAEQSGAAGTYQVRPQKVQMEVVLDDATYQQINQEFDEKDLGNNLEVFRGILLKFMTTVDMDKVFFRAMKEN